ncbi:MAG TPA: endo-1,4-beta-xylanase [Chitinophagaceae bacterium]|nr:endo-1,4-beta-xylanase [Chitinophagaceae bacterium]
MKTKILFHLSVIAVALVAGSCKKDPSKGILNTGNFTNTSGSIKDLASAAGFQFGFGADYASMTANSSYASTVQSEANVVTFGNELKYGSIVQNDGSFDYSTADAFYNLCNAAGLQVYGHNLVWYQQQNTTYLNSIVGGSSSSNTNLLGNGSFENWSNPSSAPSGWAYYNGGADFSQGSGSGNTEDGSYSMAITVDASTSHAFGSGSGWHVQLASSFPTIAGDQLKVSFYAKASMAGCGYQGEGNNGGSGTSYTGDQSLTTSWTQYSYTFTASAATTTIAFDMADNPVGSTVYLDNVVVTDLTQAAANSAPAAIAERVDSVLHLWISDVVGHYAGKIKAWDVLNEPLADDGTIRTNSNLPSGTTSTSPGVFVWSQYLGKDVGVKAFTYAHAADPAALLFINDYNLESSSKKLDSLIAYVNYLKSNGAQVDGIGTQMHVSINSSYAGIDAMFQKLAATGLKIRISELDVKINPDNKSNFSQVPVDKTLLASQADMYKYIVNSYIKNVPAAQRYGITVWGVNDNTSWLYNNGQDYPLLFDNNFAKKAAYAGFLQGLQSK